MGTRHRFEVTFLLRCRDDIHMYTSMMRYIGLVLRTLVSIFAKGSIVQPHYAMLYLQMAMTHSRSIA